MTPVSVFMSVLSPPSTALAVEGPDVGPTGESVEGVVGGGAVDPPVELAPADPRPGSAAIFVFASGVAEKCQLVVISTGKRCTHR